MEIKSLTLIILGDEFGDGEHKSHAILIQCTNTYSGNSSTGEMMWNIISLV